MDQVNEISTWINLQLATISNINEFQRQWLINLPDVKHIYTLLMNYQLTWFKSELFDSTEQCRVIKNKKLNFALMEYALVLF